MQYNFILKKLAVAIANLLKNNDKSFDQSSMYISAYSGAIKDDLANTTINVNTAVVSSTVKQPAADYSINLTSNKYLTVPGAAFTFGSADFTIEAWVNLANNTGNKCLIDTYPFWTKGAYLTIGWDSGNIPVVVAGSAHGVVINATSSPMSANAWHHVAYCRTASVGTLYIDGVSVGSWADTTAYISAPNVTVGYLQYLGGNSMNGYMGNLKVVKGKALYTANFTPDQGNGAARSFGVSNKDPFLDQTAFIFSGDNTQTGAKTFTDNSGNAYPFTVTNGAVQTNSSPFGPTSGSVYLDGSSYISTPANAALTLADGDFTIEAWVNLRNFGSANSSGCIVAINKTSNGYAYAQASLSVGGSGVVVFAVCSGPSTFAVNMNSVGLVSLDTWTHIAGVRSGSSFIIYINGVAQSVTHTVGNGTFAGSLNAETGLNTLGYLADSRGAVWSGYTTGYISNARVVKQAVYTSNFTVPSAPLAVISNTQLLLNFSPFKHNSTYLDSSGNNLAVNRIGAVVQGSVTPFDSQGGSGQFNGTGSSLIVSNNSSFGMGTGDFTVECWFKPKVLTSRLITLASGTALGTGLYLLTNASGNIAIGTYGTDVVVTTTAPITLNTWHHIAVSRVAGVSMIFVNGILVKAGTDTTNYGSSWPCLIGKDTSTTYTSGYISNVRIVKGTGLYTANFAVPTTPLLTVAGTSLLLNFDNASITDKLRKFNFDTYSAPVSYKANAKFDDSNVIFNGTTDRLTCTAENTLAFGTGDFTIEAWVNVSSLAATLGVFATGAGTTTNPYFYIATSGAPVILFNNAIVASGPALTVGTWAHIAVTRFNGSITVFTNGVPGTAVSNATSLTCAGVYVGSSATPNQYFNGHLQDLRVTKGVARYTATFVPTQNPALTVSNNETTLRDPLIGNTGLSLSTIDDSTESIKVFTDNSGLSPTVTVTGTPYQTNYSPFVTQGGSGLFNGNADYLSYSNVPVPATGAFTWETWLYTTSTVVQNIYSQYLSTDANRWNISLDATSKLNFGAASAATIISANPVPVNQWVHVAITRDSNNTVRLFINGNVEATANNYTATLYQGNARISGIANTPANGFIGYLSNMRIVSGESLHVVVDGYPVYNVPTSPLTAVANTKLLMNFNRAQSNLVAIDSSSNNFTVSRGGNATQGTHSPFGLVGGSAYFDGTGDFFAVQASSAMPTGTGDFTIELFAKINAIGSAQMLFSSQASGAYVNSPDILLTAAGKIQIGFNSTNPILGTSTLVTNTWYHIALCRVSGTTRLFINGAVDGSYSDTANYVSTPGRPWIGIYAYNGTSYPFNGYITNVRITHGQGRYSGAFTVPNTPFTADVNTKLLLKFENASIMNSLAKSNIEPIGNPVVSTTVTKYAGGSVYFNGSSYLNTLNAGTFDFGTGDFTIESWIYPTVVSTAASTYHTFMDTRTADTNVVFWFGLASGKLQITHGASFIVGTTVLSANKWYHVSATRYNGVLKIYLNGVVEASVANTTSFTGLSAKAFIGAAFSLSGYYTGYMQGLRVTKAARYITDFTPFNAKFANEPTFLADYTNDSFKDKVACLVKFDEVGVVDATGNTVVSNKGMTISNGSYVENASGYFSGAAASYLTIDPNVFNFGSGDFTVETWVNPNSVSGVDNCIIDGRLSTGDGSYFYLGLTASGKPCIYVNANYRITATTAIQTKAWTHLAYVRIGTTGTLYVNGVNVGTWADNTVYAKPTAPKVGQMQANALYNFIGYMDNLRVTKAARYTQAFTPNQLLT